MTETKNQTKMHTFIYDKTPYISIDDLKIWLQKELIHYLEQGDQGNIVKFIKYQMSKFEEFENIVIPKRN